MNKYTTYKFPKFIKTKKCILKCIKINKVIFEVNFIKAKVLNERIFTKKSNQRQDYTY
jgi:hypothetical protein